MPSKMSITRIHPFHKVCHPGGPSLKRREVASQTGDGVPEIPGRRDGAVADIQQGHHLNEFLRRHICRWRVWRMLSGLPDHEPAQGDRSQDRKQSPHGLHALHVVPFHPTASFERLLEIFALANASHSIAPPSRRSCASRMGSVDSKIHSNGSWPFDGEGSQTRTTQAVISVFRKHAPCRGGWICTS